MSEILGLLDALEATVLEAKRIPMTDKVMLEEKNILRILDKIRSSLSDDGNLARKNVEISQGEGNINFENGDHRLQSSASDGEEDRNDRDFNHRLKTAEEESKKIKSGAEEYADYVLANLQLMMTKLQKNMITLERNIENGRTVLEKAKSEEGEKKYHEV